LELIYKKKNSSEVECSNILGIDKKNICLGEFWFAIRKAACLRYARTRQARTRTKNMH
jgi:hypothetical protein